MGYNKIFYVHGGGVKILNFRILGGFQKISVFFFFLGGGGGMCMFDDIFFWGGHF